MKKINWIKVKERISTVLKVFLLTVVMFMGFWTLYVIGWMALDFPCNLKAAILLGVQAAISEIMIFRRLK